MTVNEALELINKPEYKVEFKDAMIDLIDENKESYFSCHDEAGNRMWNTVYFHGQKLATHAIEIKQILDYWIENPDQTIYKVLAFWAEQSTVEF